MSCTTDDHCSGDRVCLDNNTCSVATTPDVGTSNTSGDTGDAEDTSSDSGDTDLEDTADVPDAPDTPDVEDDVVEIDPTCGGGCPGLQSCNTETGLCTSSIICTTDLDCAEDMLCYRAQCLAPSDVDDAGGCSSDAVCTAQSPSLSCSLDRRVCRTFDVCATSDDCPQGTACLGGFCGECATDGDCAGGLTCDTAPNSRTFGVCIESDDPCGDTADCRGDRICEDGTCNEPACEDDFLRLEGGASCSDPIRLNDTSSYNDLQICGQTCDWFTLDLQEGSGALARLLHDTQEGDLDIALYEACANGEPVGRIAQSATTEPDERVAFPFTSEPRQVLLSVCAAGRRADDQGTVGYSLDVLFSDEAICVEDVFDLQNSNDVALSATQLPVFVGAPFTARDMRVCADAPDWYRISIGAGELVYIAARFDDAQGDLTLRAFRDLPSSFSAPLATGTASPEGESLAFFSLFPQDVYIEVNPNGPGAGLYDLEIARQDGCFDRLEEPGVDNNTWDTARDFTMEGTSRFENGLSICGREIDWYSNSLAAGEALSVRIEYDPNHESILFMDVSEDGQGTVARRQEGVDGVIETVLQGPDRNAPAVVGFQLFDASPNDVLYSIDARRVPYGTTCVDDRLGNVSRDTAARGVFSVEGQSGILCPTGDVPGEDWFAYDLEANATATFSALVADGAEGAILEVYDTSQNLLTTSTVSGARVESTWAVEEETRVLVRLLATTSDSPTRYALRATSQSVQEGQECGEDRLEFGGDDPDLPNDTWENKTQLDVSRLYPNLVLCPSNTDWYALPVLGGIGYTLRIQVTDTTQGAMTARIFGPLGPPENIEIDTTQSNDGLIEIRVDGENVFDGGLFGLELNSSGNTVVWYDILHTIGD